MPSLLNELHFWSTDENISLKPTDYGAFKYHVKKDSTDVYQQSKKAYCVSRGITWTVQNKRPVKLKDKIKELEEYLVQSKVVYVSWEDNKIHILLSKGYVVTISTNSKKTDINNISFNKQLVPKLHSELICDGVISGQQTVAVCTDGRVLGLAPYLKDSWTIETGNKRYLSYHREWLVLWGKAGAEHPQPWSPMARDHERANLHLYYVGTRGPELLAYKKTDGEPLAVIVSKVGDRSIVSVEQKVSQRGAVSVEVITLELIGNILKRVLVTLVPLQTQISCCVLSDNEEQLLLGCIDGSVAVLNRSRGSTRTVKASFIPTFAVWHKSNAIMAVANERGQLQYFDNALNCVQSQIIGEDSIPTAVVDVSGYFNTQTALEFIHWGPENILAVFERGPILILKNEQFSLDFISLSQRYLSLGKVEKAIALLLSWEFNQQSFVVLQKICTHLMKLPLTEENAKFLQDALGSFHSPAVPISTAVRHRFGSKVESLTRRFFHQLVRSDTFETAFLLAVDLGHHDLFMDLHYIAVKIGETEMAAAARAQASALLSRCSSEASNCSRSSCSQCSETGSSTDSEEPAVAVDTHARDSTFNYTASSPSSENYLTTNFNNATPKTYAQLPTNILPIPNVDIPKIHGPRVAYVKPPTVPPLNQNKSQVSSGLLAPPLPFVPAIPDASVGIPYESRSSLDSFSVGRTFSMPSVAHQSNGYNSFTPFRSNFTRPFTNRFAGNGNYADAPFMFSAHSASNLANSTIKISPVRPVLPPPLPVAPTSSNFAATSSNFAATSSNFPATSSGFAATSSSFAATSSSFAATSSNFAATSSASAPASAGKKQPAKVKFSDTVTAFIVPEVKRPVRPAPPAHLTDPQKELADSLPLCHPNEDYLKDFAPVKKNEGSEGASQAKIKVVHFGVV